MLCCIKESKLGSNIKATHKDPVSLVKYFESFIFACQLDVSFCMTFDM